MTLFGTPEAPAREGVDLKLTAVGGCGLALLDRLRGTLGEGVGTVAIDTDKSSLTETEAESRLLLGEEITEGYGTGGDERLASRALGGRNVEVRELLGGARANLLIGGLGGGTATALLPELARISRAAGVLTLIVATRPFQYEGLAKTVTAKRKMHSLVRSADCVFLLNNDLVAGEGAGKLSASEAVRRSDAAALETISGLMEFLLPRKRLLLDFGIVKSQLTRGGLAAHASGMSAMRNNAIEALKAAIEQFAHRKSDITKAPRALIQFAIDDDVLMDGVRNAFGVAQRIFSKDAQLAMGVVFNGVKQGKTRVGVVASGLPLFNEVVELDFAQKQFEAAELSAERRPTSASRAASLAGGRARMPHRDSLKVLNPRPLSDEELKIPAYLRRRMTAARRRA